MLGQFMQDIRWVASSNTTDKSSKDGAAVSSGRELLSRLVHWYSRESKS